MDETIPSETTLPSPEPSSPTELHTLELSEQISELPPSDEIVTVTYTWVYGNNDWAWMLDIPRSVSEASGAAARAAEIIKGG